MFGIWGVRLGLLFVNLGEAGGLAESLVWAEILLVVSAAMLAYYLVDVPSAWLSRRLKDGKQIDDMLVPIVRKSLRVTVVLFALVSIAQSLSDKPISAMIAGLGIGGLALL